MKEGGRTNGVREEMTGTAAAIAWQQPRVQPKQLLFPPSPHPLTGNHPLPAPQSEPYTTILGRQTAQRGRAPTGESRRTHSVPSNAIPLP